MFNSNIKIGPNCDTRDERYNIQNYFQTTLYNNEQYSHYSFL